MPNGMQVMRGRMGGLGAGMARANPRIARARAAAAGPPDLGTAMARDNPRLARARQAAATQGRQGLGAAMARDNPRLARARAAAQPRPGGKGVMATPPPRAGMPYTKPTGAAAGPVTARPPARGGMPYRKPVTGPVGRRVAAGIAGGVRARLTPRVRRPLQGRIERKQRRIGRQEARGRGGTARTLRMRQRLGGLQRRQTRREARRGGRR